MPLSGNLASIYLHYPFCMRKCGYCHFYSVAQTPQLKEQYLTALHQEITLRERELRSISKLSSLYFGGGTPSLLEPVEIEKILAKFPLHPGTEITLEANPEAISAEKLKAFVSLGINRISFGVQTFDDHLLALMTRNHTAKRAIYAVEEAFRAGFNNISIDLMIDLPTQTLLQFEESLRIASSLPISHLSLYNLTIEPKTAFHTQKKRLLPLLPSENTSLELLEKAKEHLKNEGFWRYEISAWAREKKFSIHNLGYWTRRPYLGFGPSAHSFWENERFCNLSSLSQYCKKLASHEVPIDTYDPLPALDREKELFILRLRVFIPFSLSSFSLDAETLNIVADFIDQGLINYQRETDQISLSEKGALFYDSIAETII